MPSSSRGFLRSGDLTARVRADGRGRSDPRSVSRPRCRAGHAEGCEAPAEGVPPAPRAALRRARGLERRAPALPGEGRLSRPRRSRSSSRKACAPSMNRSIASSASRPNSRSCAPALAPLSGRRRRCRPCAASSGSSRSPSSPNSATSRALTTRGNWRPSSASSRRSTPVGRRVGRAASPRPATAARAACLVEAAWAYRHPAKVSRTSNSASTSCRRPLQDLGWKAQVRLCKRFRRLVARGQASERRGDGDRARTDRLHVGHRPGDARARVTLARGGGGTWAPVQA